MAKKRRKHRHCDDDDKREIVALTPVPGVSVSRVVRRYNVNADLVFKWIRDPRFHSVEADRSLFLLVEVVSELVVPSIKPPVPDSRIKIKLNSGYRLSDLLHRLRSSPNRSPQETVRRRTPQRNRRRTSRFIHQSQNSYQDQTLP